MTRGDKKLTLLHRIALRECLTSDQADETGHGGRGNRELHFVGGEVVEDVKSMREEVCGVNSESFIVCVRPIRRS